MAALGPTNLIHLNQMITENNLTGVLNLLDEGINPNEKAPGHLTPLFLATKANNLPIVKALLAKGAIPAKIANGDLVDEYHELSTPYIEAERQGFQAIIKEFNNAMRLFWQQYDKTARIVAMTKAAFNSEGLLVDYSPAVAQFASSKNTILDPAGARKHPIIKSSDGTLFAIYADHLLGHGTCGNVFVAQNLTTKELCAVKQSPFKTAIVPQHEIDALRKFNRLQGHQTVKHNEETGTYYHQYLFMSLHHGINGLSVRQAIMDHDLLLSPIEQLKMIQGMLKECQELNALRFQHGDLDTRNILFEPISWKPTIIDFGKYGLPSKYHRDCIGYGQTRFALYKCAFIILTSLEKFSHNSFLSHDYERLMPSLYRIIREYEYIASQWYSMSPKHIIEYTDDRIDEIDLLISNIRHNTISVACPSSSSITLDSDDEFIFSPPSYTPTKKRLECENSNKDKSSLHIPKVPRLG